MNQRNRPLILSVATAIPEFCISASEYIRFVSKILSLSPEKEAIIRRFVQGSEIQQRYIVYNDFLRSQETWRFFNNSAPLFPSTHKRNELYKHEAPKLALQAAEKALQQWGQDRAAITHIVFVSCTGLVAPGIECYLMHELGLTSSIIRTAVNFMGCFGALRALSVAQAFAQQDEKHRILIVCTELCSLHIQEDIAIDTIIANALFADGAAAMIVGAKPCHDEKPLWEIIKCAACVVEYDQKAMRWDVTDHGFAMRLTNNVPQYIRKKIYEFIQSFITPVDMTQCDWAVHPGGKSILQAIEQACDITVEHTASSWEVMKQFGNMSSVTVPFVLAQLLKNQRKHDFTISLAFGPGLSAEGVLLKNV